MSYFECKHCLKKFVRESAFKKHRCEQMKRHEMLRTPTGVAAYAAYCEWLGYKGFKSHSSEQFMDSRLFTPFILFTRFATKMALPAKDEFMKYMAEKDIYPRDWTTPVVYEHYMESFDELFTPDEQLAISLDTIRELSRIFDCEPGEVFLFMEPATLIRIIQAKKLSPWFLLNSRKFEVFMQREMTREQKILLEKYIDKDRWKSTFSKFPKRAARIKSKVVEAGL